MQDEDEQRYHCGCQREEACFQHHSPGRGGRPVASGCSKRRGSFAAAVAAAAADVHETPDDDDEDDDDDVEGDPWTSRVHWCHEYPLIVAED